MNRFPKFWRFCNGTDKVMCKPRLHFTSHGMRSICIGMYLVLATWMLSSQAAWPATQLVISGGEPERTLLCLPLEAGTSFHLEFINSIYLAPVRETLIYEPAEGISIIRVESPSAGVFEYYGLTPDGSGTAIMRRSVGEIRIRSHDYENHRLTVGDKSVRFKGLVADGESVTIKVLTGNNCGH